MSDAEILNGSETGALPPSQEPEVVAQTPQVEGSGGVDPTRPIGDHNPPAATQFQPGCKPGPGRPKGSRDSSTIMRAMFDAVGRVDGRDDNARKEAIRIMNEMLGLDGTEDSFTQREFMLAAQLIKAKMGDTAAARYCTQLAGEMPDEDKEGNAPLSTLAPVTFVIMGWAPGEPEPKL